MLIRTISNGNNALNEIAMSTGMYVNFKSELPLLYVSNTEPQIDYNYAKPIHILFLFSEHDSDIVEQSQISTADMFPTVDWIQNMAKAKQFSRR